MATGKYKMHSINTNGMDAHFKLVDGETLHVGTSPNGTRASLWKLTFRERVRVALGAHIMAAFPEGAHPKNFKVLVSIQKETPVRYAGNVVEVQLEPDGSIAK